MYGKHGYGKLPQHGKDAHNRCCNGRFWCVPDVCGVICCVMTWLLVLYADFVVSFVILAPAPDATPAASAASLLNFLVFNLLAFLALASHTRAMLTDPGAVPKGNATRENIESMCLPEGEVVFKCPKCISIKPSRAHHCSVCQRCIRKMDHHCPWVNNCVGEANQKYFVLFTLYIALLSLHGFVLAGLQFLACVQADWRRCSAFSPPSTVLFLLLLLFEALLFAIFTLIMFFTQASAIWNDETGIEHLKKEAPSSRGAKWRSVYAVLGRAPLQWLWPFSAPPLARPPPGPC